MKLEFSSGSFAQLGAHLEEDGTNFAVFSAHANQIDLCLFSEDGAREIARMPLPERTGDIWHGLALGIGAGTRYGFRAHGNFAPEQGHRFNPNKLLMDPYTRELRGQWHFHNATLGYQRKSKNLDLSFDPVDSAPYVPKSVVSDPELFESFVRHAGTNSDREILYEAHPKGLTMQHKGVPERIRGKYEGLASDAILDHLIKMGITAIELLPVHAFVDEGFLIEKGMRNYWGYNSIGFFAPEPRYFGDAGFAGFASMVRKFHAAGIKVILDVVYNHTAEGDQCGPTLCYRGLDNASYYRLDPNQPRYYINDTGCGNTLNVSHPFVLRMVMDSLRFWVEHMGVDGFRFDLATTLAREDHGFDRQGGFLDALRQDPILSKVALIAEPWDVGLGGYQLGEFPAPFREWNDGFRDNVRRYWRGDDHSTQELGARLLGSAGQFDRDGRRAWTSLNFITAHDGFTLTDVTRYSRRHNEANGENGADGHGENYSDNCGFEGETNDPAIVERRLRRQRNMLATLLFSQGTPMLLAGDEIGNSQNGNNNAYCQDNELGWINWEKGDHSHYRFLCELIKFRKDHNSLCQSRFLHGEARSSDNLPDIEWRSFDGSALHWDDPGMAGFCLLLRCSAEAPFTEDDDDAVFLVFNRSVKAVSVVLPEVERDRIWVRSIDTGSLDILASNQAELSPTRVEGETVAAFARMSIGTETGS